MSFAKLAAATTVVTIALVAPRAADALPQFARKYKMPCTGCHDALAYPRLNDVGYKFRRAGFRMPENIGKEELTDFDITDYFAARAAANNTTAIASQSGATNTTSTYDGEAGLYFLTGSFQNNFASEGEVNISPDGGAEIENAYVRVVLGDEHRWFEARAGIFHAFEGLGASDRSLGPSRPLIFDLTPNQNQDTLMRMVELNRIGAEVGGQWENSSLSVEVVNRAHPEVSGGGISPVATTADAGGGKDLIIVANQILGARSGLSAYWSHGQIDLPVDEAGFIAGTNQMLWNEKYDKIGAFASGQVGDVLLLGGAQLGFDQALDATAGMKSGFTSIGGFLEGNYALEPWAVGYLRADYFNPSTTIADNHIFAGTVGTLFYKNWVSIAPELQVRRLEATSETDATLLVHAFVVY
jgi:hypothetical protein